jgi:hypothetical protein
MTTWIHPSLLEKEIISNFVNSFKSLYFECLIGNLLAHFMDVGLQ